MTLVSLDKHAKQRYNRDIYTQTLIYVTTRKQVCHIEQRFEKLLLEYNSIDVDHSKMNNPILNNSIVDDSLDPLNWFSKVGFSDED